MIVSKKYNNYTVNFLVTICSLLFWLFIVALPPFYIGLWVDSESVLLFAHILFCLISCGLFVYTIITKQFFISSLSQLFILTSLFSLAVTVWSENKILHHIGVPMLGEGTVFFTGISMLSLVYDNIDLKNYNFFRYSAIFAATVALVLMIVNHPQNGFGINSDWVPYVFGAFLAPIAIGMFSFYFSSEGVENKFLILIVGLLVIFSFNKTLWAFLPFILGVWYLLKNYSKIYRVIFSVLVPIGVIAANLILPKFISALSTLESRRLTLMVYVKTWVDDPLSLLYGHGWGSYFNHLTKNLTQIPINFFQNGTWQPSWDGIDRIDFHAMHQGAESMFSLGILGLIFYLLLIIHPITAARKNHIYAFFFSCCYAALSSTWFTLICVWPFLMLGFSEFTTKKIIINRKKYFTIIWVFICSVLSAHAAITVFKTAILYPTGKQSIFYKFTCTDHLPSKKELRQTYNYNGLHLSHYLLGLLKKQYLLDHKVLEDETYNIIAVYNPQTSPLNLDIAMLHLLKYQTRCSLENQELYSEIIKAIIAKSPKRPDLLESYVNYLLECKKFEEAECLINKVLKYAPDDAFGVWYKGVYLVELKQADLGLKLMKKALELKADNFLKIPEEIIQKVKAA